MIGGGLLIGWYAISLPRLADLRDAGQRKAAVRILAEDGTLLARYGSVHGQPILIKNLPPMLANAVLATEAVSYTHLTLPTIYSV